uniref:Uncharacterized protein n=1 Tax=Rhizophora mucronata TaxID=61149 RepID=A0A2P2QQB8_RHIMU
MMLRFSASEKNGETPLFNYERIQTKIIFIIRWCVHARFVCRVRVLCCQNVVRLDFKRTNFCMELIRLP